MRDSPAVRAAKRIQDVSNTLVAKMVDKKAGGMSAYGMPNKAAWKRAGDAAASLASDAVQKVLPGGGVMPRQVLDAAGRAHQKIVDDLVAKSHGPRST